MRLADHMCVIPFHGSSRDRRKVPILEEAAGIDEDFLSRALPPSEVPSTSKLDAKSKSKKRRSPSNEVQTDSQRITISRLIAILQEAYVTTMKSFATKPGGLGGLAMGGKIDLPDATPTRTFNEPRQFVRSWSKHRPDYIRSPAPEFAQRAQPGIAVHLPKLKASGVAINQSCSERRSDLNGIARFEVERIAAGVGEAQFLSP
ncbi:unnamed protein product [Calypogeia fissa]